MTDPLDDYLGLLDRPLAGLRMLVFHGDSGSGKSGQIRLLVERHAELRGRPFHIAAPGEALPAASDVLVIEELRCPADARLLGPALARSRLLLVASHLPPWQLWPWRLRCRHRCYSLDRHPHKLARWLRQRNVQFSPAALADFQRRHGANYTDLDIVLRHAGGEQPATDFDRAYALFRRGGEIQRG